MKKVVAAKTMVYRRPIMSEVLPERRDPIREHTLREPIRISSWVELIFRSSFMYRTAPLITPISVNTNVKVETKVTERLQIRHRKFRSQVSSNTSIS